MDDRMSQQPLQAAFDLLRVETEGRLLLRARAPFRRPSVTVLIDGRPVGSAEGRMAPEDDLPDAVFELPRWALDGRVRAITLVSDEGETLHTSDAERMRFRGVSAGRIETVTPDGRLVGWIETPGLSAEHLPARVLIDGETDLPFLLGADDLERRSDEGVTRFRFDVRLPTRLRTGRCVATALCVDTAGGCRVLHERAVLLDRHAPGRWGAPARSGPVVILDPSLKSLRGHQVAVAEVLTNALRGLDVEPILIGHQSFAGKTVAGLEVRGGFSRSLYDIASVADIGDRWAMFGKHHAEMSADLKKIIHSFPDGTTFLIPTVNEYFNYTLAHVVKSRGETRNAYIALLMLETGLARRDGRSMVQDPHTVDLYRSGFDVFAREERRPIRYFAISETHRRHYQMLTAQPIGAAPPLLGDVEPAAPVATPTDAAGKRPRRVLLYGGEAKLDKGFHFTPEVAERLLAAHPDVELVMQVHNAGSRPELARATERLRARRSPRLRLLEGFLDYRGYLRELAAADLVVLAYDPRRYAAKTSGVFWETLSLGAALVAPRHSWLHDEAELNQLEVETFETHEPSSVADAALRLLDRLTPDSRRERIDVRGQVRRFLGSALPAASVTRYGEAFARDPKPLAGVSPVWLSASLRLDADAPCFSEGWTAPETTEYRRPGRWMSRRATIDLPLLRDEETTLVLRGEREAGDGIAAALEAKEGDGPLDVAVTVRNARDFLATIRLPRRRGDAPTRLLLSIPDAAIGSAAPEDVERLLLVNALETL